MKLLAIGKTKVKCRRKDNKEKWYASTSAVISYAKNNLKKGDIVIATFNDDTRKIEKITKLKGNSGSFKKYPSTGSSGEYTVPAERSALQVMGNIMSGLEGITEKTVEKIMDKVFSKAMGLLDIKPKKDEEDEENEDENEEDEEENEDEEEED